MKRVLTLLVTMGLATAGLVGLAPAQATLVESQASPPAAASLLFTQYADSAKVERIRGKRWKVILNDVDPKTLWFTDRPVREAGRMGTASFVRQWTSYGFTALPPNAVIQHSTSPGAARFRSRNCLGGSVFQPSGSSWSRLAVGAAACC